MGDSTRVNVIGTAVTACRFQSAVELLAAAVEQSRAGYVSPANAYSTSLAHKDRHYRDILNGAFMVTADGMPIVWAMRSMGYDCERVHNDDLVLSCCAQFPRWRHYLVGGREGQPEAVAQALRSRFPDIEIVGMQATPVRPVPADQTERIIADIKRTRASVVWAALGTPAQDYWMSEAAKRLDLPLVGCGSLFDLLSGRTHPAPDWIKSAGLQWLFRLILEPRRLFARYLVHNSRFVAALAAQQLNRRRRA